mmetsp:Transcript_15488/g.60567  ORF Transcript_15488/g.60567 Transcript_15488/m.60567 type:complete len:233 (-) Transcript_15488:246-944(-)
MQLSGSGLGRGGALLEQFDEVSVAGAGAEVCNVHCGLTSVVSGVEEVRGEDVEDLLHDADFVIVHGSPDGAVEDCPFVSRTGAVHLLGGALDADVQKLLRMARLMDGGESSEVGHCESLVRGAAGQRQSNGSVVVLSSTVFVEDRRTTRGTDVARLLFVLHEVSCRREGLHERGDNVEAAEFSQVEGSGSPLVLRIESIGRKALDERCNHWLHVLLHCRVQRCVLVRASGRQ